MRHIILAALTSAALCVTMPVFAKTAAPTIAAAVGATDRPVDAVALDTSRKPAEVLAFLGLKPGMKTADVMTGSGYWAEIMAKAVGPKGHVTALEPTQFAGDPAGKTAWEALLKREPNVSFTTYSFEAFTAAPNSFDFTIINLSYHDVYWVSEKYHIVKTDPDAFVKALFAATKPGGTVGIIDHVGLSQAEGGSDTRALVDALHRIDPAVVKADFIRAGFVLEAQSDLLANPADDHSLLVFKPEIRGKTDRFVFRFRKPAR